MSSLVLWWPYSNLGTLSPFNYLRAVGLERKQLQALAGFTPSTWLSVGFE